MHYVTKGTCSRAIDFDVVDGKVTNTKFTMGCMGNTGCCSACRRNGSRRSNQKIKRYRLRRQRNIMPRSVGKST